ncbi:MAG: hypothetical protein IPL27_26205 [Lewinellaceae bacterium]|nr:hypothetical protein [Lewinellaceae bacterium]
MTTITTRLFMWRKGLMLAINGLQPNKYLNNAFLGARYFQLDNADAQFDYSKFSNYQLIVLHELPVISLRFGE